MVVMKKVPVWVVLGGMAMGGIVGARVGSWGVPREEVRGRFRNGIFGLDGAAERDVYGGHAERAVDQKESLVWRRRKGTR